MKTLRLLFLVGLATGFISEKTTPTTPDDLYLEGRTSGELPIDDEDGDDEDGSGSGSGDYIFGDLSDQEEMLKRFLNYSRTTISKEMVPAEPESTADSPRNTPITRADSQDRPITVEETETTPVIPDGDSRDMEVPGVVPTAEFPERTSPSSITVTTSETTAADIGSDLGEDNSLDRWDVSTTKASGDEGRSKEMNNEIVAKDGRGSRIYEKSVPEEVTSENMWERTEVLAAVIACGVVGFLCAVFLLLLIAYRMKKKDEGSYDLGDTKLSSTSYQKAPTKEFYA